jgi:acetyl-CoA carboxylase biotin carboxyl carrier protein
MSEIRAPITGSVWQLHAAVGDTVEPEQVVAVLESMKLEIPVESDGGGIVARVLVEVGDIVMEGDPMFELDA